mgnify:CR=1 FL=1
MITFKEYIGEAFKPDLETSSFGWQKVPRKDKIEQHTNMFKTKGGVAYRTDLHSRDPKEGHFLSFERIDKTKATGYKRSAGKPREVPEIVHKVMSLTMKKAKDDEGIKKVHFAGADKDLSHFYDKVTKSDSFHHALKQHGFKYAGKSGEYHTIEKE